MSVRIPFSVLAIVVAALAAPGGCSHSNKATARLKAAATTEGEGAQWQMTTLDGDVIKSSDFDGKVVLIDFWATWCGPCVEASPVLQRLHDDYAGEGLVVIGANAADDPSGDAAREYRKEHGYSYRMTYGNDALKDLWGVDAFPTFVFVDRKGEIVLVESGFAPEVTEKQFRKKIESLLKGQ